MYKSQSGGLEKRELKLLVGVILDVNEVIGHGLVGQLM